MDLMTQIRKRSFKKKMDGWRSKERECNCEGAETVYYSAIRYAIRYARHTQENTFHIYVSAKENLCTAEVSQ